MTENQQPLLPAMTTAPVKLKDKMGRGMMIYDLKQVFGFLPEKVVIQKIAGKHDTYVLSAILTEEELAKRDKK